MMQMTEHKNFPCVQEVELFVAPTASCDENLLKNVNEPLDDTTNTSCPFRI